MKTLNIVGAGIGGLTAAIEAAEAGWTVRVSEAAATPGGRSRTLQGAFRANIGPHAVYVDGQFWQWLKDRDLDPEVAGPPPQSTLFRRAGRLDGWPSELTDSVRRLPASAPGDLSFRDWLNRYVDGASAEALIHLLFITVYDHDPGRLSAEFMRERLSRTLAGSARYVVGGWSVLIRGLVQRAADLGVCVNYREHIEALPDGPLILATKLKDARRLIGDQSLDWPSGQAALLDLGLRSDRGIDWFRVIDLDSAIYVGRFSALDSGLAPPGHDLVQIAAAIHPGESTTAVQSRVCQLLDAVWPRWSSRLSWRREAVMRNVTGALDPPGGSWRDRPRVIRQPGMYVVSDQSAAPGMLAEVSAASAMQAVAALSRSN